MSSNLPAPTDLVEHSDHPDGSEYLAARDAGGGPPSQGAFVERALSAIRRRKWIILLVTAVGTAGGVLFVRSMPLEYQAEAVLWVATARGETGPLRSTEMPLSAMAWADLLKSKKVLDHVVRQERIYLEPAELATSPLMNDFDLAETFAPGEYLVRVNREERSFVLTGPEGVEIDRGAVGETVGEKVGFVWRPSADELLRQDSLRFLIANPALVARALSGSLKPRATNKEGTFISLILTGQDPHRTSRILNAIARRSSAVTAEIKGGQVDDVAGALEEQLQIAEERLRNAEIELENRRVETVTLPSNGGAPVAPGLAPTQSPAEQQFFALKGERAKLHEQIEGIELFLRQFTGLDATGGVPPLPTSQAGGALALAVQQLTAKEGELREAQKGFTDEHPAVLRLLEEVATLRRETIPEVAQGLLKQLKQDETDLDTQIEAASRELRDIPPRVIEEGRLARTVSIADNLANTLKQRYEASRLAAASSVPDLVLLDSASVPDEPIEDKRIFMMLMAFGASLGLSVGGVLLIDRLDPRVRYPDQVTQGLGIPILGAIPRVEASDGPHAKQNASVVGEAFRELCFSIVHACGGARPLLLTVTSPAAGDGKSFIAANLALTFARQGHRTLLLDADMRRGTAHRLLDCDRVPGLSDFLAGAARYDDVVHPTGVDSLFLIPAGRPSSNAGELLSGGPLAQLMRELRSSFDVIVIDSPPLGAGVDSYLLATVSGDLLLVLRTGNTPRALAEAKLGLLDRLPVRLIGAVLNDILAGDKVYSNYSYLPEYHQPEDALEVVMVPARAGKQEEIRNAFPLPR